MREPGAEGGGNRGLIAGILLAAGQSIRFGRPKLIEAWQGEPLVRRAARGFLDAGLDPVIVVVSSASRAGDAMRGLPVIMVPNPRPEDGISASIACGLHVLPDAASAALIGVADQPRVTAQVLQALMRAYVPGKIVVPVYGDHRGNPALFDRGFLPELLALDGDRGGQVVVGRHPEAIIEVALPEEVGEDIDEPEQWSG